MSTIDDGCEDSELRDLVAHTLESNGVLNKIRAQLRASVFLALEEQPSNNRTPLINKEFKDFIKTDDGRAVVCLIREFLEFFNLEFTQSVFTPETEESIHYNYTGRDRLLEDLGLDKTLSTPILLEILRRSRTNTFTDQISPKNISVSRDLFNSRDKDRNGKIDRETANDLLMDVFPNFRRSLVDRFILDEYQAMGKNLSAELNYDDFFSLYKKLYSICQSVTLHDTALFVPAISSNKLQKSKMSTVETINISPIPSSIGIEKNDFSKANSEGEGGLIANLTQHSIKDDNMDGDDSFFDDPPIQSTTKSSGIAKGESNRCSAGSENAANFFRDSLPPLVTTRNQDSARDSPLLATLERDINSKLADLSNEDYDEDFQSSEQKTGSDGSIGEEIEEDTSAFGDLLGSTASGISLQGNENITTDKTVSQVSQSGADYLESLIHDSRENM